jgi:hypothetical protein
MINKKNILLLLALQISLIGESFGLSPFLENIVGGIKQIPSMARTIPQFVKNTLLPHSKRWESALFIVPYVINQLSNENSKYRAKYEAMHEYLNKLLNTNEKNIVELEKEKQGKQEKSSIQAFDKTKTNTTEKEIWNHRKQTCKEATIYKKIEYVESLFTPCTLNYYNIKTLELDLADNISFWEKVKIIAGKTFTDYTFLALPTILISLSIMGKEKRATIAWSLIIPTLVTSIKIADYYLLKKIYEKKANQASEDIKNENDLRFKLLSSCLKNPSTSSLLTIASVIFLFYVSKKSAAQ